MSQFRKIFVAIDDITEFDKKFEDFLFKVIDSYSYVRVAKDFNVSWDIMKKIENKLKGVTDVDTMYDIIETFVDNYVDEIYDIVRGEDSDIKDHRVFPTVFIRDHKQDNRFRNKYSITLPRIIQFIPDENNKELAGKIRVDNILDMGIDCIVAFTNRKESNKFGIEYIQWKSQQRGIKMFYILDGHISSVPKLNSEPENLEQLSIMKKIIMNSEEYKKKFRKSVQMIRKTYYESVKNQPQILMLDKDEIDKKRLPKVPTKSFKKKQMKLKPICSVQEELVEESYD